MTYGVMLLALWALVLLALDSARTGGRTDRIPCLREAPPPEALRRAGAILILHSIWPRTPKILIVFSS